MRVESHLHVDPLLCDLMSVAHAVWGNVCIMNMPFSLLKLARTAIRAVTGASISITVVTIDICVLYTIMYNIEFWSI